MSGRNNESPSFFHALHTGVRVTDWSTGHIFERYSLALVAVRRMRSPSTDAWAANYTQPMALFHWISHHGQHSCSLHATWVCTLAC